VSLRLHKQVTRGHMVRTEIILGGRMKHSHVTVLVSTCYRMIKQAEGSTGFIAM